MSDSISAWKNLVRRYGGGFILAFHDLPPSRCAELVAGLGPFEFVSLDELVHRSLRRLPSGGLAAITVDDGVGETVRLLSAIFLARQWPATFYLPTDYIDTACGMAFQRWRALAPLLPRRRFRLPSGDIDLSSPRALRTLSDRLHWLWRNRPPEEYSPILHHLSACAVNECGIPPAALDTPPPITWSEVSALSRHDLLRFESHGVSHSAMSCMSEVQLEFELRHSRDIISQHTGRDCRHLAYPFGGPESIGRLAPIVARRFYHSATTMALGHVEGAHPWLLPRIPLYPENPLWFARLKVVLKGNRLARSTRPASALPTLVS